MWVCLAIFIGKMMGIQYFFLAHRKLEFPMKNADFPWRKVNLKMVIILEKNVIFLKNGDFPIKNGMPLGLFLLLPVGPVSIALGFKSSASPRSLGRLQNCLIRWLRGKKIKRLLR